MSHKFKKHYTVDEAQAMLPVVQLWLMQLRVAHEGLEKAGNQIRHLSAEGQDSGGASVNTYYGLVSDVHEILSEFRQREIVLKDIDRGLVDFPTIRGGREVFLCWEEGEDAIEFWHELDVGYAGREHL